MSRPKKATVDYFPHYVNHGKTMFTLENKYGNNGYAFWFKLLELLGSTEQHFVDCREQDTWQYLLAKTRISENTANEILDLLSRMGTIDEELWQNKIIWSSNFIDNLSSVYARRGINVFTKADIKRFLLIETPLKEVIDDINPQSTVKDSVVKDNTQEELEKNSDTTQYPEDIPKAHVRKTVIFKAPSVEEVIKFFLEHGFDETLARRVYEGYEVADWHDSKGKAIKNWKQKMIQVWFTDDHKNKQSIDRGQRPGQVMVTGKVEASYKRNNGDNRPETPEKTD